MIDEAMPTMWREMLVIDMSTVSRPTDPIVNPCGQICGKTCEEAPRRGFACGNCGNRWPRPAHTSACIGAIVREQLCHTPRQWPW